jgi:hypothetical protein
MVRVSGLQRADQKFELGKTSQTREAGIFQEVRPASEAGADAPLQPGKGTNIPAGTPVEVFASNDTDVDISNASAVVVPVAKVITPQS